MKILVINAGSSSLKYQLINMADSKVLAKGIADKIGLDGVLEHKTDSVKIKEPAELKNHADAIHLVLKTLLDPERGCIQSLDEIAAIGHRIVHGGVLYNKPMLVDEEVIKGIEACSEFAPLHNPAHVVGIRACVEAMPGKPQVVVFDTAFHQTMPPKAYTYALPQEYYDKYKVRRYGAHGTSHKYVSLRAAEMLGKKPEELKVIVCHLGSGASISAVKNGKCVDTSMGFTPLAGLMMGTRCGDIDPAIVTYIMEKEGLTPKEMDTIMNKKSGLLAVSGLSSDFRAIDTAIEEGNERAKLALDIYEYETTKYIGAYAAAMGGVDVIAFTAGVGENNGDLRYRICEPLKFMGVEVDPATQSWRSRDAVISTPDSKVTVMVIATNEELMIARETEALVKAL